MSTLLLQIKLVENISCLRMQRMPNTKGESLINALQKKQTTNQNATLWHLQYLLARYFSKIDPMHTWLMVDGWHPNILLSAFKLGPLTLFLSWKIKRIFYLNLPPPKGLLHNHYYLCVGCVVILLCSCWWGRIWHQGACIAWLSQQDFIVPSKEIKITEANLNADVRILKCQSFFCIRSIKINVFEFIIY